MAAWPAARLGIAIGMKNGLIRSGPFATEIAACSANVMPPPIPVPRMIPVRSASEPSSRSGRPASASASRVATRASCV